jgi:hypothetical protein
MRPLLRRLWQSSLILRIGKRRRSSAADSSVSESQTIIGRWNAIGMRKTTKGRVIYPIRYWTPIRREVFEEVLPQLQIGRAALIYFVLYMRGWRAPAREVTANIADMARWTGLDPRTINRCVGDLVAKGVVRRVRGGHPRSRTEKPVWKVPLTEFNFKSQGPWVPVPRFIVDRYCRANSGAVLLPVILWHQHLGWRDWCWPGTKRLAMLMNWSKRRVYAALATMGRHQEWEKLGTGLPQPLEIKYRPGTAGGWIRHLHVRAVRYGITSGRRTVRLDPEFAQYFKIPSRRPDTADEGGA